MTLLVLSSIALLTAFLPAAMTLANRRRFTALPAAANGSASPISILIPARNEADGIVATVRAACQSEGARSEVIVLDDHSSDDTVERVRAVATEFAALQVHSSKALPAGWNGKQHACHQLAQLARYDLLLFIDADVRLGRDAIGRIALELDGRPDLGLLSLFPHQETGSFWERLLIPLMHFVLLGFLPFARMQQSRRPEYAAGCGQLFCARRVAYEASGGHAAIRTSRHDGLMLPRAFRRADWMTDCRDGTDTATCRMYRSGAAVVRGLLKNATEGIANARLIFLFTFVLFSGGILPFFLLAMAIHVDAPTAAVLAGAACGFAYLPRGVNAFSFRQSWLGVLLHPLALAVFLGLQWVAFLLSLFGYRPAWRGRAT